MKREDVMQGYWSVAVDEKRPSLAVDDAVLVGAPGTVYEWENGGRGTGNHVFGTRLSEIWESYELSPRLKFGRLVGWG
ncbi:MAG: hypothetical protein DI610_02710 [Staphylococcus hominis]|nr:MAG: hypothetical protein DI610_02710 [Staphylococcus hominis]